SRRTAQQRGRAGARASGHLAAARGTRRAARGRARARPHAGLSPALRRAGSSAGPGRCRMVDHGHPGDRPPGGVSLLPHPGRHPPGRAEGAPRMSDKTLPPSDHVEPVVFTRDQLDWLPWLEPMAEGDLTARHMAALVDAARAKSPYFRLLARDPEVLEARTR